MNSENPIGMIQTREEIVPFVDACYGVSSYRVRSMEEMGLGETANTNNRRRENFSSVMFLNLLATSLIARRGGGYFGGMSEGSYLVENSGAVKHPAEKRMKHHYRGGR